MANIVAYIFCPIDWHERMRTLPSYCESTFVCRGPRLLSGGGSNQPTDYFNAFKPRKSHNKYDIIEPHILKETLYIFHCTSVHNVCGMKIHI